MGDNSLDIYETWKIHEYAIIYGRHMEGWQETGWYDFGLNTQGY